MAISGWALRSRVSRSSNRYYCYFLVSFVLSSFNWNIHLVLKFSQYESTLNSQIYYILLASCFQLSLMVALSLTHVISLKATRHRFQDFCYSNIGVCTLIVIHYYVSVVSKSLNIKKVIFNIPAVLSQMFGLVPSDHLRSALSEMRMETLRCL